MQRVLLLCFALCFAPSATAAAAKNLLVFGDSLSAGYGLPRDQGWAALLARRIQEQGLPYSVVNASLSGETTAGGVKRIEGALKSHRPSLVVLELGANDGLRGVGLDTMRRNLETMVQACRRAGAEVVLVGMRLPPNYGREYAKKFHQAFLDVARRNRAAVVPFLFEGFADNARYFQPDGVHPTSEAQPIMLETVWRALRPLLKPR